MEIFYHINMNFQAFVGILITFILW